MKEDIKEILFFMAGLIAGVTVLSFFYTMEMSKIVMSATELLTVISDMAVDYINLAKECNITGAFS